MPVLTASGNDKGGRGRCDERLTVVDRTEQRNLIKSAGGAQPPIEAFPQLVDELWTGSLGERRR